VWEAIFFLLILKIPIVYLCCVVWWAVRAEPRPEEGAAVHAQLGGDPPPREGWRYRLKHPRRPHPGPHGSPRRGYARHALAGNRSELKK
jgi:hypothetical protein